MPKLILINLQYQLVEYSTVRRLQVKIENIYVLKKRTFENIFKNWLYPNFSCCPKNLSCPQFWGGCRPPRPARPVRLCLCFYFPTKMLGFNQKCHQNVPLMLMLRGFEILIILSISSKLRISRKQRTSSK